MSEHLLKIKKFFDCQMYFDSHVSEEDHITYILDAVSVDYNALVVSVTLKRAFYSVSEISSLLLTNERLLEPQALFYRISLLIQLQHQGNKRKISHQILVIKGQ